jgi:hypothetical protein
MTRVRPTGLKRMAKSSVQIGERRLDALQYLSGLAIQVTNRSVYKSLFFSVFLEAIMRTKVGVTVMQFIVCCGPCESRLQVASALASQ